MPIRGSISIPGDKSISHRSLMIASLINGKSIIHNLSTGMDVNSTKNCLAACGTNFSNQNDSVLVGGGFFKSPETPLDCGNSGTSARLLSGLLVGKKIDVQLIGDESLTSRPMDRIIAPLKKMGAKIESSNGRLPINILSSELKSINYEIPIASAQVKSCLILAALDCNDKTILKEQTKTRDHTEIMLQKLGVNIKLDSSIVIEPLKQNLEPFSINIPGDPSSAAFFASSAALIPNSDLTIKNLLANSTRIAFFDVLKKMGAIVSWGNMRKEMGEIIGDVNIKSHPLSGIHLSGEVIPSIIDEIPIIAVLATQADSPTIIRNAEELRHKESDRIDAICYNIKKMGIDIIEMKDGFIINPEKKLVNAEIKTFGDHRIAMAFSIAELLTSSNNVFDDLTCIDISFPNFFNILKTILK